MTAITSAQSYVQIEETKFGTAISEYTTTKVGANINYIYDNYQPLSYINVGIASEAQQGITRTYTYTAPYRLRVHGFRVTVNSLVVSAGGSASATLAFTSSFTTGSLSFSRTTSSSVEVNIDGTVSSFGVYSSFDTEPTFDGTFVLDAGDTLDIIATKTGTGLLANGSYSIQLLAQKELAP